MRAVVAVLLFVTVVHAALWGVFRQEQQAPDFKGILPSLSYAPFERGHVVADVAADSESVRADLKKLATLTRAVRLYTSTEGSELVPPIAAEFGLKVTVGAWIDKNVDRNEREIEAAINLAKRNSNVNGVVVGNDVTAFKRRIGCAWQHAIEVGSLFLVPEHPPKGGMDRGHNQQNGDDGAHRD